MNGNIKYILLDAANTLIHKPLLWGKFMKVFERNEINISQEELIKRHKLISEVVKFPDVTSEEFYDNFNKELLNALGVIETPELLKSIFLECKNLSWQAYDDALELKVLMPNQVGVLSNFSAKLNDILKDVLKEVEFGKVFISEEKKVSKPNLNFFKIAINELQLAPEEILYVGDSLKLDVIPALKLGMKAKLIDRYGIFNSIHSIRSLKDILKYIE